MTAFRLEGSKLKKLPRTEMLNRQGLSLKQSTRGILRVVKRGLARILSVCCSFNDCHLFWPASGLKFVEFFIVSWLSKPCLILVLFSVELEKALHDVSFEEVFFNCDILTKVDVPGNNIS